VLSFITSIRVRRAGLELAELRRGLAGGLAGEASALGATGTVGDLGLALGSPAGRALAAAAAEPTAALPTAAEPTAAQATAAQATAVRPAAAMGAALMPAAAAWVAGDLPLAAAETGWHVLADLEDAAYQNSARIPATFVRTDVAKAYATRRNASRGPSRRTEPPV
jgi:hypothetical protein